MLPYCYEPKEKTAPVKKERSTIFEKK